MATAEQFLEGLAAILEVDSVTPDTRLDECKEPWDSLTQLKVTLLIDELKIPCNKIVGLGLAYKQCQTAQDLMMLVGVA